MSAVSCASASFCTAIGHVYAGSRGALVAQRWDGTSWQYVPIERVANVRDAIDLACPAENACIAVASQSTSSTGLVGQAESWVLRAGQFRVVTPRRPATNTALDGVFCWSGSNCTAVGYAGSLPLIEHWDGTVWDEALQPAAPHGVRFDAAGLSGITCPQSGTCIAGGTAGHDPSGTALLAYLAGGKPWRTTTLSLRRDDPRVSESISDTTASMSPSCIRIRVCAGIGSYLAYDGYFAPLIAWRDRTTHRFTVRLAPAFFNAVSCVATSCIYVGKEWVDPQTNSDPPEAQPVIYRGTGLTPVQQTLPQPTR